MLASSGAGFSYGIGVGSRSFTFGCPDTRAVQDWWSMNRTDVRLGIKRSLRDEEPFADAITEGGFKRHASESAVARNLSNLTITSHSPPSTTNNASSWSVDPTPLSADCGTIASNEHHLYHPSSTGGSCPSSLYAEQCDSGEMSPGPVLPDMADLCGSRLIMSDVVKQQITTLNEQPVDPVLHRIQPAISCPTDESCRALVLWRPLLPSPADSRQSSSCSGTTDVPLDEQCDVPVIQPSDSCQSLQLADDLLLTTNTMDMDM